MLDINYIKKNSEKVKQVIEQRGVRGVDIDKLLHTHDEYLDVLQNVEKLRNLRNEISSKVSMSGVWRRTNYYRWDWKVFNL